jgi:hypothetical protein
MNKMSEADKRGIPISLMTLRERSFARTVEEILQDGCWWLAARSGKFAVKRVLMVDAGPEQAEPRDFRFSILDFGFSGDREG